MGASTSPDDLLSADEVGAYCDPPISGATIRSYAARGQMPAADRRFGQGPAWYRRTIDEWKANRPGRGTRPKKADKQGPPAAIAALPTMAEVRAAKAPSKPGRKGGRRG